MELNIKKIEAYLETVKISALQFCKEIGLSYSAWNTMKNTKRISVKSLTKIADFMKVDPSELLSGYIQPAIKPESEPASEEMKFISARMNEFMKENKLSVAELSELIHIPYRTLKYQITNNCIGTTTLAAIAKVFTDVNIGWFFTSNKAYSVSAAGNIAAEPEIGYGLAQEILAELKVIKAAVTKK